MKINIDSLYNKEKEQISFSLSEDVDRISLYGMEYELISPVSLEGKISRAGRNYRMKANVKFTYLSNCSRCLAEVEVPIDYDIDAYLMREDYDEGEYEDNDVYRIDSTTVDLLDIIDSTLSFNLPQRVLCDENCAGICSGCGVNLNTEDCKCEDSSDVDDNDIDPRFAKLKELLK